MNNPDSLYLHLNVNNTSAGVDPIDTLQELFDFWYLEHPDVLTITIENQTSWNLVGLPIEVEDSSYNFLFPEAINGTLFSFDSGYQPEINLTPGKGYWLRFPDAGLSELEGGLINELEISLSAGWNMISGISETVSIYSIVDPDGIIIPFTLYDFNEGYSLSESLAPGKGYWIRTNQSGTIIISY